MPSTDKVYGGTAFSTIQEKVKIMRKPKTPLKTVAKNILGFYERHQTLPSTIGRLEGKQEAKYARQMYQHCHVNGAYYDPKSELTRAVLARGYLQFTRTAPKETLAHSFEELKNFYNTNNRLPAGNYQGVAREERLLFKYMHKKCSSGVEHDPEIAAYCAALGFTVIEKPRKPSPHLSPIEALQVQAPIPTNATPAEREQIIAAREQDYFLVLLDKNNKVVEMGSAKTHETVRRAAEEFGKDPANRDSKVKIFVGNLIEECTFTGVSWKVY